MNKLTVILIAVVIIVGGGAFYGGIEYGKSTRQNFAWQNLDGQNLSPEQRQQFFQGNASGTFPGGVNRAGVNFISGEIIAKDENSITLKLTGGSSKIIFYSDTTEVSKFATGTSSDLEVGKTVMINGKTNQDGSLTAQSIQIRPETKSQP